MPVTKSALSPEPSQPKQPSTGSNVPAAIVGVAAAGTAAYALAAPLPYTSLGQGAAHGATDLDSVKGVSTSNSSAASAESASPASTTTASAARLAPPGTASGGERSTSMASITAINRGHEGNRQSAASPLVESTLANDKTPESASSKAALGAGVAGVAGGAALAANGVRKSESGKTSTELKDSAPGRHEDSLGHPSTRAPETTREPGTYPKADLNGPAVPDKHSEAAPDPSKTKAVPVSAAVASGATKNDTPVSPSTGGLGNAGTVPATSPRASTVASTEPPQTPKSPTNGNVTVVGDDTASSTPKQSGTEAKRRTSSGGSSKKKVGFMSKLKGEIKVLSGKLDNDKDKVEAGKRMMHGGEYALRSCAMLTRLRVNMKHRLSDRAWNGNTLRIYGCPIHVKDDITFIQVLAMSCSMRYLSSLFCNNHIRIYNQLTALQKHHSIDRESFSSPSCPERRIIPSTSRASSRPLGTRPSFLPS